jgi:hypothetical protein
MEINFKKWLNEDMGGLINPSGSVKPISSVPVKSVKQGTTPPPNDTLTPLIKKAATEYQANTPADVNDAALKNPEGIANILAKFEPALINKKREMLDKIKTLTGVNK